MDSSCLLVWKPEADWWSSSISLHLTLRYGILVNFTIWLNRQASKPLKTKCLYLPTLGLQTCSGSVWALEIRTLVLMLGLQSVFTWEPISLVNFSVEVRSFEMLEVHVIKTFIFSPELGTDLWLDINLSALDITPQDLVSWQVRRRADAM